MDSFDSESITGDSSTSQSDTMPPNQEQCLASTRKTRRTEDLISADISKSLQDSNQPIKRQRQNISFLPKIELSDDVGTHSVPKHHTLKQNRPSLAKKTAIFKIGRSMIEGKQFQGTRKANTFLSKFPKIKLKLTNRDKSKGKSKVSQKISKRPRTSDELMQVLSDAAEEFLSQSEIKLKRSVKGFSRKSGQKNNESARMIFKELYVNLVPLEKTNLLNEEQRSQLKPQCPISFNKRDSKSNMRKIRVWKENLHETKMEADAQLSINQSVMSADGTRKSLHSTGISCLENFFPCKVILERLTIEQIRVLTSLKTELDELTDENTSADDALPSTETNSLRISGSVPSNRSIGSSHRISSLEACGDKSNKSMKNCEESFFNPKGSSSPLILLQKLNDSKNTTPLSSSMKRRLTFEVDNVQDIQADRTTSSIKSQRSKSTSKNDTYELHKSSVDVPGDNKDVTFEMDVPTVSTIIPSAKLSNSFEDGKGKKKRSPSCDSVKTDFSVNCGLSEKEQQFEEQRNTSMPSIPKKRRSTLTLEDSVNDIFLLKSTCDVSGTPQQLNRTAKAKSQSLINQLLDNKSISNQLDYSNITTRKHWSTHSESMRNGASHRESTLHLDSISGAWNSSSNSIDDDFELTDGVNVLPSSFVETIQCIDSEREESSGEEEEEEMCNANRLSEKVQGTSSQSSPKDIIELSDEESSSGSYDGEQIQGRRVTFETDTAKRKKLNLPKVLLARDSAPKSVIKSGTSSASAMKNRRVTFSSMSVVIVDDSSTSDGSPDRKSISSLVPTNFPSDDDDDSSEETTVFNKRHSVGRTSIQKGVESPTGSKENKAQSEGCFQSPHFSGRGRLGSTPIQVRTQRNSTPQFNKRGIIGRTPLRLKIPLEDNTLPKINKRLSSGERLRLQNETVASPVIKKTNSSTASKRTKMPDFANMHKRMFDKMLNLEEHSKKKDKRAKLLLSGHKPGSSLKKSTNKQIETNSQKRTSTKKQLKYGEAPSSASSRHKQDFHKKTVLASSTPKSMKNEKNGYTRYGFKAVDNSSVTKKEQLMAIANKKRLPKSNTTDNRTEIKGVRSNRRFDLLMKMRQKSQK